MKFTNVTPDEVKPAMNDEQGRYSSLVFLDYSKDFDFINPEMLLAKMIYFGFSSDAEVVFGRQAAGDQNRK
ncbi:hypothetical protein J6590_063434, partial [Homalodisca vitripennis]